MKASPIPRTRIRGKQQNDRPSPREVQADPLLLSLTFPYFWYKTLLDASKNMEIGCKTSSHTWGRSSRTIQPKSQKKQVKM